MKKQKWIIDTILGTILSVLLFFSISFITFLTNVNPFHHYAQEELYHLEIGFPFTFYSEFLLNGGIVPNSQWAPMELFYDCLITWVIVTGLYVLIARRRRSQAETMRKIESK